jgi:hypothetical protein
MKGQSVRYSEAFKRRVVDELELGKYLSIEAARRAYSVGGTMTASSAARRSVADEVCDEV